MASNAQKVTQTAINDTLGLAAVMFQNTGRLLDIQAQATKSLLQSQTRNVSAVLGTPDFSQFINPPERLFESTAQRAVGFMRQTNEVISQLQSQINEFVEQRSTELAANVQQTMQQSIEELEQVQTEVTEKSKEAGKSIADTGERANRNQPQAAKR